MEYFFILIFYDSTLKLPIKRALKRWLETVYFPRAKKSADSFYVGGPLVQRAYFFIRCKFYSSRGLSPDYTSQVGNLDLDLKAKKYNLNLDLLNNII